METKKSNEIEVTQYLRPDGKRVLCFAPVGEFYVEKAEGMIFSAEVSRDSLCVLLYARLAEDPEEEELCEIASNGPGPNEPPICLRRMIDELYAKREARRNEVIHARD